MEKDKVSEFAERAIDSIINYWITIGSKAWYPENCDLHPVELLLPKEVIEKMQETFRKVSTNDNPSKAKEIVNAFFATCFAEVIHRGLVEEARLEIKRRFGGAHDLVDK